MVFVAKGIPAGIKGIEFSLLSAVVFNASPPSSTSMSPPPNLPMEESCLCDQIHLASRSPLDEDAGQAA